MEIRAVRYDTAQPVRLEVAEGRVVAQEPLRSEEQRLPWIAPGLVDL